MIACDSGGETMANIKQQIKRVRTNEKARQANMAFKSSLKTAMKAVYAAVKANDLEKAQTALSFFISSRSSAVSLSMSCIEGNFFWQRALQSKLSPTTIIFLSRKLFR